MKSMIGFMHAPSYACRGPTHRFGIPTFIPPKLATLVEEAPAGDAWLRKVKLDDYTVVLSMGELDPNLEGK